MGRSFGLAWLNVLITLSSFSEVQTSGNLDHISKTGIPPHEDTPAEECSDLPENNLTVSTGIKGSSQVQFTSLCEITSNYQNILTIQTHEVETLNVIISQSSFFSNPSPHVTALSTYEPTHSMIKAEPKTSYVFVSEDHLIILKSDVNFETPQSKIQPKKITPSTAPVSKMTLALIVASLASNASSHSNLRPQRRHHRVSFNKAVCPSVKNNVVSPSSKASVNSTSFIFKKETFTHQHKPLSSSKGFTFSKRRERSVLSRLCTSKCFF